MAMQGCRGCGRLTVRPARMPYYLGGEFLGYFEAELCASCGGTYFTPAGYAEITQKVRQKGIVTSGITM
jgi:uncharacterized OB-fold protein